MLLAFLTSLGAPPPVDLPDSVLTSALLHDIARSPLPPLIATCKTAPFPWVQKKGACDPSNGVAKNLGKAASDVDALNLAIFDLEKDELTTSATSPHHNRTMAEVIEKIMKAGEATTSTEDTSTEDHGGRRLRIETVNGAKRQIFNGDSRRAVNCPNSKESPFQTMVRVDAGGASCSGVLVGPRHVLTAGHCIFSFYDADGNELLNSAKGYKRNVFVSYSREWGCPISNSDDGTDADNRQTVRFVGARSMVTYHGWTDHGDAEYDIALILLQSRPRTWHSSSSYSYLGWMSFGWGRASWDWSWCTAGWPGDKVPKQLYAECNKNKVQDIEKNLFEMELDGAQGQSGSPLWASRSNQPNGDHGTMYNGEAGPATGVFSLLYQQRFWLPFVGWIYINESNDFARISADRFATLCAYITDTTRSGETNPCPQ